MKAIEDALPQVKKILGEILDALGEVGWAIFAVVADLFGADFPASWSKYQQQQEDGKKDYSGDQEKNKEINEGLENGTEDDGTNEPDIVHDPSSHDSTANGFTDAAHQLEGALVKLMGGPCAQPTAPVNWLTPRATRSRRPCTRESARSATSPNRSRTRNRTGKTPIPA